MDLIYEIPKIYIKNGKYYIKWGSLVIEIPKLKHNVIYLMPSVLATQYCFCEYKIHLDYLKGRLLKRNVIEGVYEHERQIGKSNFELPDIELKPGNENIVLINVGIDGLIFFNNIVSRSWIGKFINKPEFKDKLIPEISIMQIFNNVPLLAIPDLVIIHDKLKISIIELKTTKNIQYLKPACKDILQLKIYAYVCKDLGLNVKSLMLIKLVRGTKFRIRNYEKTIFNFIESDSSIMRVKRDVLFYKINGINFSEIKDILINCLEYWLYKRNPIARPDKLKCINCEHFKICNFAKTII